MSGRELASISMLHTHNFGNSSPFLFAKNITYPICQDSYFCALMGRFFCKFWPILGWATGEQVVNSKIKI